MNDAHSFFNKNANIKSTSADNVGVALMFLQVARLAESQGYSHGLKPSQWAALRYFAAASVERRTVSSFAAYQGATRGAASQMVDVLVKKGLLIRGVSDGDRRVVRLELTEKSFSLLAHDPLRRFVRMIDALPDNERCMLELILRRLSPPTGQRRLEDVKCA